jgi:hypothetical protein
MSFCRWSSDNFQCDLYCYEDVSGGITTHVASNRVVGEIPEAPFELLMNEGSTIPEQVLNRMTEANLKRYMEAHRRQMDFLETCKREPIGLPYDGQSFNDPDYESFLARLLHLRETGYHFPDYVLDLVKEAIKEQNVKKES